MLMPQVPRVEAGRIIAAGNDESGRLEMDRKAITRFRKSLEARHRELRIGVAKTQNEMLTAQHDYGKDDGDRANTSLAKELHLGQKSRDRAVLSAVDTALKRIRDGTFGECLNCGQEINAKRLEALPWVRYCITCQELIDGA
jgi:DnaK suppressor protein